MPIYCARLCEYQFKCAHFANIFIQSKFNPNFKLIPNDPKYAIKNANTDEKTTNQIPIQTITQQELGRPKMSKDKQKICVKTGKSKTYNLVHPKRLAANIHF